VHIKSTTYVVLKAKEKRCVLRRILKLDSEEACRRDEINSLVPVKRRAAARVFKVNS